jgi:hypothetical protein
MSMEPKNVPAVVCPTRLRQATGGIRRPLPLPPRLPAGRAAAALLEGATHEEIVDAYGKHFFLWEYADARREGASHSEVIEAGTGRVRAYTWARRRGCTHAQALEEPWPGW